MKSKLIDGLHCTTQPRYGLQKWVHLQSSHLYPQITVRGSRYRIGARLKILGSPVEHRSPFLAGGF